MVANAPIAELFIAAPGKYKDLVKNHNIRVKLALFAIECATAMKAAAPFKKVSFGDITNRGLITSPLGTDDMTRGLLMTSPRD